MWQPALGFLRREARALDFRPMAQGPTASPEISPDGKFYWDGQRWIPLARQARSGCGRGLVIGILLILVVVGALVLGVGLVRGQDHTLKGTMTLHEVVSGTSCTGTGGYSDIQAGTEVVVKDQAGKVLATASLGDGRVDSGTCVFDFSVSHLPDADFYQVEVSHRGNVTYSKADLEKTNWTIGVELGA